MTNDTTGPVPGSSQTSYIERLLSPEREHRAGTATILELCLAGDNVTVADIGCGPGYYTVALARALGRGKVIALDPDDEMLEICRRRVGEARLGNVEVLKCGEYQFPPDEGSIDALLLACVVHHADDRVRFLVAVRRLLLPKGRCTVVEWYRRGSEDGPPLERRIDPDELEAMAVRAGFRWHATHRMSGDQYLADLRNG